jgi:hypothetical protein
MELNEIKPIVDKPIVDKPIVDKPIVDKPIIDNDKFHDAKLGPHKLTPESESESDVELDDDIIQLDDELVQQLKQDISKNSLAIADLKLPENNSELETPRSPTTPTTPTSSLSRDSDNPKKKKKKKPKIFPRYVYADIFDEKINNDDSKEWTNLKRYRFQKCLWKLKYNRIVSTFYLDNLKRREERWSWMIIVISTLTSGLTVANNVESEPVDNYNTWINGLLTVSSMSTSLIAAWIKKQLFIEKINETDKYLLNINSLCEELEVQFSLLNTDRTSYVDFKKKYIPEITKFLTTNPMIPPCEWKACIREITLKYPELVDPDNTEDNKLWPWYGDLVFDIDDNMVESHVRKPTTFMAHFKKTNTDRLRSTCCGKKTIKNVY